MDKKYYPKEIEIVMSYINQFNYSDKYISSRELELLLEKKMHLSIEELEKILVNSSKISKKIDFIKNIKVSNNIVMKKRHLYLFYYCLINFFEHQIGENKLRKLENFFRKIFKNKNLNYGELNLFERNFYDFLKMDSLKNKGFEIYLYEKFIMYFKSNEKDIYRFCKEYYILMNSFTLKKILYRYLEENKNRATFEVLKAIDSIIEKFSFDIN